MMANKLEEWCDVDASLLVVDIGSYNINGTLKDIVPESWSYWGLDRVSGPNVDMVMCEDYFIPLKNIDVVISSSCFQYVRNPFKLMQSIANALVTSGVVIVCAPREEKEGLIGLPANLCPDGNEGFDCWRFLKGGMTALLSDSGLEVMEIFYDRNCCWGVGKKP
jgi:hypothetical protein